MMSRNSILIYSICSLIVLFPASFAWSTDADSFHTTLTPLGAERKANADASIPAWDAGLQTPPTGYTEGSQHVDPYAEDQALFTVSSANADQYAQYLSAGQLALLTQYPDMAMHVYPSRRSAAFPEHVYTASIDNDRTAKLLPGGQGVSGARVTSAFPRPESGLEAIWNHLQRYRGEAARYLAYTVVPTPSGAYVPVLRETEIEYIYSKRGRIDEEFANTLFLFRAKILSPPRLAGNAILAYDKVNQLINARDAWQYSAGSRRVRRVPTAAHDNYESATDGERTSDSLDQFNGATDRYQWALLGKREMFIPYNAYRLHQPDATLNKVVKPNHPNPDLLRYELHRVWVVEARLKPGKRHLYHRRVFFLDEDSWQIAVADLYGRDPDKIYKVSELHPITYYEVPLFNGVIQVQYNLENGRYVMTGLDSETRPTDYGITYTKDHFSPTNLRSWGRR